VRCRRHERDIPRRIAGLALVGVALFAAGCGNAKRDFREHDLNPRIERVDSQRAQLARLLRVSRPNRADDATALRGRLAELRAAMRDIAKLRPPDGVEDRFRRYVEANSALLDGLTRFVDAFATGSRDGQREAQARAQAALARAGRAQTELQHALQ
jgi:hypothetical protein